jgi:hypothetical protein
MKAILLIALLFFVPLFTQTDKAHHPEKKKESTKKSHVKIEYDKFRDMSLASVALGNVVKLNALAAALTVHYEIYMTAFVLAQGSDLSKPTAAGLRFYSTSANWRFNGDSAALLVIADGERMDLGYTKRTGADVVGGYGDVHVNEELIAVISISNLKRLASASRAEMQLSGYEFKLSDKQLSLLRELSNSLPQSEIADATPHVRGYGLTLAAYNLIEEGMTYEQVVQIIGQEGIEVARGGSSNAKIVMYRWQSSNPPRALLISFINGTLKSKSQTGLR